MSDQDNGQVSTLQRPTTDQKEAWRAYWEAQGWSWRTEPEIGAERQKYLAERRAIVPNMEKEYFMANSPQRLQRSRQHKMVNPRKVR